MVVSEAIAVPALIFDRNPDERRWVKRSNVGCESLVAKHLNDLVGESVELYRRCDLPTLLSAGGSNTNFNNGLNTVNTDAGLSPSSGARCCTNDVRALQIGTIRHPDSGSESIAERPTESWAVI
jgi:hypothetical protein